MSSNGLPQGWGEARLADLVELNPKKPRADVLPYDAPVSFVPMPAVDAEVGAITAMEERPFGKVRASYTAFQEGDVLFAKITPCMENGKAAIATGLVNGLGFGSSEFFVLRPGAAVRREFLFHFLRQSRFRREAEAHMTGTVGQKRVRRKYLADVVIPVPPLPEQDRIIERIEAALQRARSTGQLVGRAASAVPQLRELLLKAAVTGKLTRDWRDEHEPAESGDALLERLGAGSHSANGQQLDVDADLPSTWTKASLEQLAAVQSGNTPKGIVDRIQPSGEIPWFKVGDMNLPGNEIDLVDGPSWLTETDVAELKLRVFEPGAIVFPKRGGAIATNKKRLLGRPSAVDLNTMVVTPKGEVADYVWLWFQGLNLIRLADGSNVPQINHTDIKPLVVPLPPVEEQREIVRRAHIILGMLIDVDARLRAGQDQATSLVETILNAAFNGRLVPTQSAGITR